jgi:regulator of RNase E activity RraA
MSSNGRTNLVNNSFGKSKVQRPDIKLPVCGMPPARPDPKLLENLKEVSSATASAKLHQLGIRQTFIQGPTSRLPGSRIVGPAITLQFMPQREDIASGQEQEDIEKYSALWAVLEEVQVGDILVVQAYADPYTGCFGEMLLSYFQNRGGQGLVIDGYIRDWPHVKKLNLPIWACGVTPNYVSQSGLFPWGYNVPIACSRVLVLPGDIIIADDDGAVLVPIKVAPLIVEQTLAHEKWETFSRLKLAEGGALAKYYPLNEEGQREYEEWCKNH